MASAGRLMMLVGLAVAVAGAAVWALGRAGFRGLPGDIRYENGNFRLYLPVVTCVVVSVVLTALMWLWQWLGRR
jgi:hypothetical protein